MKSININQGELNRVREFIRKSTGISISPEKIGALQQSLQIRFHALESIESIDEYLKFIKYHPGGGNELKEIIKLITITKTDFFRYPPQFEALENWVLPEYLHNPKVKQLAIWSAGCSTGEEPYSIALSLIRRNEYPQKISYTILATDINVEALELARSGIYHMKKTRNIPQSLFTKYFHKIDQDKFEIIKSIKEMIEFEYHNLVDPEYPVPPNGKWDIIFCRNVSIYFDTETTQTILNRFYESISEGGYLFIGHSESLFNIFDKFNLVEKGNILIYRKEKKAKRKFLKPDHDRFIPAPSNISPHPSFEKLDISPRPLTQPSISEPLLENDYQHALKEYEEKNFTRALELLDNFIQENPQDPVPHLTRGNILSDMYQYEESIISYQTAIEIDPLSSEAYLLLGIALRKKGDYDNAVSFLKRALFVDENMAPASFMLGLLYRDMGNINQAIRELTYTVRSIEKYGRENFDFFESRWCLDDRPVLEKELLLKICRENLHHLQKKQEK